MQRLSMLVAVLLMAPAVAGAITIGQVDDFEDGTLQGWSSGASNPNPPTNETDPSFGGMGNRGMLMTANSSSGAGGKLVAFNQSQWTGDYLAAGVGAVSVDLLNLGGTTLTVRLVVRRGLSSYATDALMLAPNSAASTTAVFSLQPEDLTSVEGADSVTTVLGDVTEVRLLHSTTPDLRGDFVTGLLGVDNITALASALQCTAGLAAIGEAKTDVPAGTLLLPGFEVDTASAAGLTTFFAVHNQTDEPRSARVRYFDRAGSLQEEVDLPLGPRQTLSTNVRDVGGLAVDADDVARGFVEILACSTDGEDLESSLSGDYFFLDNAGNFATGDQLLRLEDICGTVQVRLVNFGSGVKLRLFSTDPQGDAAATAQYTVFNEAGNEVGSGDLVTEEAVKVFDSSEITATSFGTLVVDFVQGGGALSVEYSAFGRFSVAMNATCVTPLAR